MSPEKDLFVDCGYFTIRCTEKFWSVFWSDLTIEKVLIRSLSSIDGLTGGRGIRDNYCNSIPACSRVYEAMEEFVCGQHLFRAAYLARRGKAEKKLQGLANFNFLA